MKWCLLILTTTQACWCQGLCPNGTVGGYQPGTPYNFVDSPPYCAWYAIAQPFSQTRTYLPQCLDGSSYVNNGNTTYQVQPSNVTANGECGLALYIAQTPVCYPFFLAGPVQIYPGPNDPGYQYIQYSSKNTVFFVIACVPYTSGGATTNTCGTACLPIYDPPPPPPPPSGCDPLTIPLFCIVNGGTPCCDDSISRWYCSWTGSCNSGVGRNIPGVVGGEPAVDTRPLLDLGRLGIELEKRKE